MRGANADVNDDSAFGSPNRMPERSKTDGFARISNRETMHHTVTKVVGEFVFAVNHFDHAQGRKQSGDEKGHELSGEAALPKRSWKKQYTSANQGFENCQIRLWIRNQKFSGQRIDFEHGRCFIKC